MIQKGLGIASRGTASKVRAASTSYRPIRMYNSKPGPSKVQSFGPLFAMGRGMSAVLRTGKDVLPKGSPRATIEKHLKKLLQENSVPGGKLLVGHGVLASVSGMRWTVGEVGAREIDIALTDPKLTQYYLRPIDDEEAHAVVGEAELSYWAAEHKKAPSGATEAAMSVSIEDRIALQKSMGRLMPNFLINALHAMEEGSDPEKEGPDLNSPDQEEE